MKCHCHFCGRLTGGVFRRYLYLCISSRKWRLQLLPCPILAANFDFFCNEFCHYWVFMVSSECWHFWRPFGSSPEIRHIWQLLVKSTWQPTGCSAPPQRPLCRQWTVTSRMTDLPTLTSWWRHLSDDDNYDDDDDDDANEVNNSDASWTVITHCTACSVFAEACGTNGAQGDTRTRNQTPAV